MTVPIEELTTKVIDGTGVFDSLATVVKAHLKAEYANNRITGSDYKDVYLGSMVTILDQAVKYVLQAELAKKQIEIADEQILLSREEVKLKQAEQLLRQAEVEIAIANLTKIPKEIELMTEQILKIKAECALLAQKIITEKAQTQGEVQKVGQEWQLYPTADAKYVGGQIGREMLLHAVQAEGFIRDAEQKATKIIVDTWNMRKSTDTATAANATNKLSDVEIGKAMAKLFTGINVTL